MAEGLYCVKMRASQEGRHISGAERIVPSAAVPAVVAQLAARALEHSKGVPDFVNVKVERPGEIVRLKSLPVATNVTRTPAEGRALAADLLRAAGIERIDEIMALFRETYSMRGAMLLDADTLERLEPDRARGVRATCMDAADSIAKGTATDKNHYAEAIVLATVGGLLGVALGVGVARLIGAIKHWPIVIEVSSALFSFGFSAFVGVFFGFYPAYRASKLNPIDCLRYE